MATQRAPMSNEPAGWTLDRVASFPRMRALAWCDDALYACRGYTLLRAQIKACNVAWQPVGRYQPALWRNLSSSVRLSSRLFRDGFHALAVLPTGHIVAAVPGAIVRRAPGDIQFAVSHRVVRGTRPLHIAATPNGQVFWGEYFDNPGRDEVHVYASADRGATW